LNISRLAIAGAATVLVAGAVIAPSAAFADSSASFSQPTICPGESVTLTVNGSSANAPVVLTPPEYFRTQYTGGPKALATSLNSGTNTWDYWSVFQGYTYTIEVITGGSLMDPELGTVLSTTSLEVLTQCAAPAPDPEPETEALPNTGASTAEFASLAVSGAGLALGGIVLARRARRAKAAR